MHGKKDTARPQKPLATPARHLLRGFSAIMMPFWWLLVLVPACSAATSTTSTDTSSSTWDTTSTTDLSPTYNCSSCPVFGPADGYPCGTSGAVYDSDCQAACNNEDVYTYCFLDRETCATKCREWTEPDDPCDCPDDSLTTACGASGEVYPSPCHASCLGDPVVFECADDCTDDCRQYTAPPPLPPAPIQYRFGSKSPPRRPPPPRPPPPSPPRRQLTPCVAACQRFKKQPVCSKNGKVYANPCEARCDVAPPGRFFCGKRAACASDCEKAAAKIGGACKCPGRQQDVCSTKGKLYYNPCMAKCHRATVRWACGKRKTCARDCARAAAAKAG